MLYKSPGRNYFSEATLLLLPWFWQPPLLPSKSFSTVLLLSVPPLQSVLNAETRQSPTKWRYDHVRPQVRLFMRGKHLQNGRGCSSRNLLFQRSNENTEEIVKINIFRTLEINQRLETIQSVYSRKMASSQQEQWALSHFNLPIPIPPALNPQHCDHSSYESQQTGSHRVGKFVCGAPWKLYPQSVVAIWLVQQLPEKASFAGPVFIRSDSESLFSEIPYL